MDGPLAQLKGPPEDTAAARDPAGRSHMQPNDPIASNLTAYRLLPINLKCAECYQPVPLSPPTVRVPRQRGQAVILMHARCAELLEARMSRIERLASDHGSELPRGIDLADLRDQAAPEAQPTVRRPRKRS
jgi:hypothetical protein